MTVEEIEKELKQLRKEINELYKVQGIKPHKKIDTIARKIHYKQVMALSGSPDDDQHLDEPSPHHDQDR